MKDADIANVELISYSKNFTLECGKEFEFRLDVLRAELEKHCIEISLDQREKKLERLFACMRCFQLDDSTTISFSKTIP